MSIIPNITNPEKQTSRTSQYDVKAGAVASIEVWKVVIKDGSNAWYVTTKATGQITSADEIVGVAASTSTDTIAADGTIQVQDDVAVLEFEAKAHTPGNLTQAIKGTKVTIDCAAGVQTIDENQTTAWVAVITDFDADAGTVKFKLALSSTIFN